MMQLRLLPEVSAKFVMWAMNSPQVYRQAAHDLGGSTSPHVNMRDIRRFRIGLPPLAEQQRIVAEIDRVISVSSDVAATAGRNIHRCSRLRQSILKWAFEGKLADQDPSDEPASLLLERITAGREGAGTAQERPRRGRRTKAARAGVA